MTTRSAVNDRSEKRLIYNRPRRKMHFTERSPKSPKYLGVGLVIGY